MYPDKGSNTLHTLAFAAFGNLPPFALPIFCVAALYFIMIMPNQRKQKRWTEMLGKIKSGDRVVTVGGIRGTVVSVTDDVMVLRIAPDNTKLEFSKSAIPSVTTADDQTANK